MGSGEIGLPALRWLARSPRLQLVGVVTQPDKPVGRSQRLTAPPPKLFAISEGIPVLQPARIRKTEALELLNKLHPDLIVVMAYGQILPRAVLELPTRACINLHASLLPSHRGAAPIQASILAGDQYTGITVMFMSEGLDTGDILLSQSIPIRRRETAGQLHDRLAELAPKALAPAISLLLDGKPQPMPQEESLATYSSKLDRESGRINWAQSCWELDRLIRAMNPWPGAFTTLEDADGRDRIFKIHRAIPLHRVRGTSGVVENILGRGLVIGCGEGSLLLLDVQIEGKRKMSASEFLRGHNLPIG
ncbi:MAG: methionyl-tRNA formyltransferase, partial [Verrucomicrobia bacterium]|nr:methionyl-tRNA formyltransferase [Verrucomicrobiota bacterium]